MEEDGKPCGLAVRLGDDDFRRRSSPQGLPCSSTRTPRSAAVQASISRTFSFGQKYRGRGLGRQPLSPWQLAVERGCPRMEWSVLNWNEMALRATVAIGAKPHLDGWTVQLLEGDALLALAQGRAGWGEQPDDPSTGLGDRLLGKVLISCSANRRVVTP